MLGIKGCQLRGGMAQPNATGGQPTVVKDLVFDPKDVKTALLIGLSAAGIVVQP
jgi:hypothetical protein